jgi:hypothetical protein
LVLEYYLLLRSVLRAKPRLRACLTRCRHCRIFFLTHPRNANRRHNLRCPFGCRQAHRQQQSTRRSIEYYREPQGKVKKSALNQKRRAPVSPAKRLEDPKARGLKPEPVLARMNEPVVEYVRMVIGLIEDRRVRRREVLEMLERVLRQHRLGRRRKIDHTLAWLNEHPP